MKKKMGRPKLPKAESKGVLYAVRVNPDDDRTIRDAIKASKLKKPEWMRNALIKAAKDGIVST